MAEKKILSIKFLVETAVYAILEKQHNGMMRERNSIKDAFETMTKIMHSSDISEKLGMILHGIKWSLLHLKGEHNAEK